MSPESKENVAYKNPVLSPLAAQKRRHMWDNAHNDTFRIAKLLCNAFNLLTPEYIENFPVKTEFFFLLETTRVQSAI